MVFANSKDSDQTVHSLYFIKVIFHVETHFCGEA